MRQGGGDTAPQPVSQPAGRAGGCVPTVKRSLAVGYFSQPSCGLLLMLTQPLKGRSDRWHTWS